MKQIRFGIIGLGNQGGLYAAILSGQSGPTPAGMKLPGYGGIPAAPARKQVHHIAKQLYADEIPGWGRGF